MAKYNFNYGKIEDGKLKYAPNRLIVTVIEENKSKKVQIFNSPAEVYAEQGWLPIVKTEQPTAEDGYYEPTYTEADGEIVQVWAFVEFEEVATDD